MWYIANKRIMAREKTEKSGNLTILEKYRLEIRFFIAFCSVRF